ncbi:hypothetical protein AMATHDRAFT_63207 [Amanita thiersii Skay4041]|uniref:Uncharacterized protein n=1 Tax=Amanita thiersii Skay4041 TaxID=703135 RepID=A0A2A9NMG8_9AGAR|nr:hypothetical protein AMATHDRAFT_63207 [Amanita thiersii Skay4041]
MSVINLSSLPTAKSGFASKSSAVVLRDKAAASTVLHSRNILSAATSNPANFSLHEAPNTVTLLSFYFLQPFFSLTTPPPTPTPPCQMHYSRFFYIF